MEQNCEKTIRNLFKLKGELKALLFKQNALQFFQ